jgi:dTDP-4-amino-4,6-dideoxygalactose transaminase
MEFPDQYKTFVGERGVKLSGGELTNTDIVMNNTFWVGVYPGLTPEMIAYIIASISEFIQQ